MKAVNVLSILFLAATAVAACGGATQSADGSGGSTDPRSSTVEYIGGCTAAACADLPVETIACASGPTTTVCEPGSGGKCVIDIECGAPSSPPSTCAPSACGDVEITIAPECPPGGTIVNDCVNTGSDCAWEPKCIAPGGAQCTPSSCGAEPAIAPVCNDGSIGSLVCSEGANGACGWVSSCDNEVDGGSGGGSPGQVDGGAPGSPPGQVDGGEPEGDSGAIGSPPIDDAGSEGFDARAWADAKGA